MESEMQDTKRARKKEGVVAQKQKQKSEQKPEHIHYCEGLVCASEAAEEHGRILLAKQGCWVHTERECNSVLTPCHTESLHPVKQPAFQKEHWTMFPQPEGTQKIFIQA